MKFRLAYEEKFYPTALAQIGNKFSPIDLIRFVSLDLSCGGTVTNQNDSFSNLDFQ